MAKTSELLLARLKGIGLDVVSVERVYRSQYGAAAGQWAWSARLANGSELTEGPDGDLDPVKCAEAKSVAKRLEAMAAKLEAKR